MLKINSDFSDKIVMWYKKAARPLPWRKTRDPYKIWIAEIMLQQTTVKAVIPYYQKWIKLFPNIQSVAKSSLKRIYLAWQGLGYYQRAKNIHKTAKIISQKYQGKIPKDPEALKVLPGFGQYTTGAVLSIAYGLKVPIVDANIRRVFMRILDIEGPMITKHDKKILDVLNRVMPNKNLNQFNQALMELGALICRSREPVCGICPVKEYCQAYKKGRQEIIPLPKKTTLKKINVAIGLLEKNRKFFIQKRPAKGLLADLWEFPGGKRKGRESIKQALKRELSEELGIELTVAKMFMTAVHYYTQYKAHLHVFTCQVKDLPSEGKGKRWVRLNDLENYPMPSGSAKIVDKLLNHDLPLN